MGNTHNQLSSLNSSHKKLKRRKAAGPDEVPMELYKETDDENHQEVLQLINDWWEAEYIPQDQLIA